MVIWSKLEHEIEHQACPVDSAHVMFPFLSQKVIKSMKQPNIYHKQTMHNECRQRQQTTHNFAIPYLGIKSRTSLQLLIGIGNNCFVHVNIASQLNALHNHYRLFKEIYCLAFSPNISTAPLFKVQLMESNLQGS